MDKRVWNSGPPPHVGWWNASVCANPDAWRWWDGDAWSLDCKHGMDSATIAARTSRRTAASFIEWTDYWPENARVPRVDPDYPHGWFRNSPNGPRIALTAENRAKLIAAVRARVFN